MTTATTGTGTITLSSAVSGYLTFATAGCVDGKIYRYGIKDGANSEAGFGTYTAAGTTFTRSVRTSTNGNAAISLSGTAEIYITALAEDFLNVSKPQGRLTLQTVTPVMTTTQSAKTTIFYTPYVGQYVPLYDGTSFNMTDTGGEISVATTDTAKNPAAIGASKVNDWFIWNDAGTIRITHSVDWTNDTTRASALTLQNGIYLNTSAITNGPGASRGTWVGTTRSNGSSQLDWIYGASASGGTAAFFGVWNMYNRVSIGTDVTDSGASYTYTSATIRQARASAGNQISYIQGAQEDAVWASYSTRMDTPASANASAQFGLGIDATTVFSGQKFWVFNTASTGSISGGWVTKQFSPGIGLHVISGNEKSDGAATCTFNSDTTATLSAMLRM